MMTGFLGSLLLQLIKLTLRGLLQPCNDFFFLIFDGKVAKAISKEFGGPFFFIPPVFWCWRFLSGNQSPNHRPESGSRAWGERWQAQRGGKYCKKEWTKSLKYRHPCSPFLFRFCIPIAFCLSPLVHFCLWTAICFFKRNSKLFCFVLLIYFKWGNRVSLCLEGKMNHVSTRQSDN